MAGGILVAKNDDADGDKDEGEEGSDIGHFGEGADVEDSGGDGDEDSGKPGGEGGCAEFRVEPGEGVGEKAVAGHSEPDARLAELEDEDGADHANERSDKDEETDKMEAVATGGEGDSLEGIDHRSGVACDGLPRHHAGEDDGYSDVEDGADDEGGDDADGDVALGVSTLFAGGGDGVEADVGEEDDGASGEDSGKAIRRKRMVVGGVDEAEAEGDEEKDGGDLYEHHDVVGAGGLADASDQDDGEEENHGERGEVEAGVPAGSEDVFAGEVLQAERKVGGGEPLGIEVDAEPVEEINDMGGEANADAHVGEGVFEDEVPADDPCNELAECGVGVGVGRAGDGDHAGELGVTEASEAADDGDEDERESQGGPSSGTACDGAEMAVESSEDEIDDGGLGPGDGFGGIAADGGADDGEDPGTDDSANAEGSERDGAEGLAERVLRKLGVGDELVDGLGSEDLSGQGFSPRQRDALD